MASAAIELKNVSLEYGGDKVLKNINLSIGHGEIFVLMGPSGQGKSVLLKVMSGLIRPTEGQVLINEKNILKMNDEELNDVRRSMGMLFQNNALFDYLTSGDNIAFPLVETTTKSSQDIQNNVSEMLEAVGLSHARLLFPDEISGGMQKRLGIARAIALRPKILLYDDPTAGLDPITSKKIVDLIINISQVQKTTTVAITNDVNRAYQLANRIGVIFKGELIITGSADETRRHKDPRVRQFVSGELSGPLTEPA